MRIVLLIMVLLFSVSCEKNEQSASTEKQLLKSAEEFIISFDDFSKNDYLNLRLKIREIKSSIDGNDYLRAINASQYLDDQFGSTIIKTTVEALSIYSKEGAKKTKQHIKLATEAIPKDSPDFVYLNSLLIKVENLDKKKFASMTGGFVAGAVYVALEAKMSHSGAIPASLAGAITTIVIEELL